MIARRATPERLRPDSRPWFVAGAYAFLALATACGTSAARSQTWVGSGTSVDWTTTANWTGTPPASNGTSALVFGGATRLSNTNTLSNFTATGITFAPGSGNFVLGGNRITLAGTIANQTQGTQTVGFDLQTTAQRTITGSGGSTTVLAGSITGAGGALSLTRSGGGSSTFILSGSNDYSGDTTLAIANIVLSINHDSALGRDRKSVV